MADDGASAPLLPKTSNKYAKYYDDPTAILRVHLFLTGMGFWARIYEEFMTLLVWAVVLANIVVTEPNYEKYRPEVDIFGFASMCAFSVDYALRLWSSAEDEEYEKSRMAFFISPFSAVEIGSIVPYFIIWVGWNNHSSQLTFVRLFRLFSRFAKGKDCGEAFKVVSSVVSRSKWLLLSTAYFLVVFWFVFGGLYHLTERHNERAGDRFSTLLSSMWWTLINLMGEFPLSSELTDWGKLVGTCTMLVAIGGVHGIPTGIISEGYAAHMTEERDGAEDEDKDEDAGGDEDLLPLVVLELKETGIEENSEVFIDRCYLFINAHTDAGSVFEALIMLLVVVNVVSGALDTCEDLHADARFAKFNEVLEQVSVGIFTAEFLVRFYATGADKRYPGLGRFWWVCTNFFPVVDLIAIVPFYVDLALEGDAVIPTTFFRVLRLFRVFRVLKAGKFIEGMNVLRSVLLDKAPLLGMLSYAVLILLVFFSMLMYYAERNNPITSVAAQFSTVPNAMWVTLLNFTGEYPLGDYTDAGKVISCFVAFVAIAVFGVPVAILSDGISEKLARLDELKQENNMVDDEDDEGDWREVARSSATGQLFLFMEGQDLQEGDLTEEDPWWETWGVRFEFAILFLIFFNTVCFIVVTIPSVQATKFNDFVMVLETISVVIYTVEYVLRCLATYGDPRPLDSKGNHLGLWYWPFNFLGYTFSPFGIIDAIAVAPWYFSHLVDGVSDRLAIVRCVRLLRVLRVERYLPVFSLFTKVLKARLHSLGASVFILLICTIVFATLLHETEKNNHETEGTSHYANSYRFRSVPSSLYYTFIHLTGDYPLMKYTPMGKLINVVMIILAQGLVAIPLGIIVEGFQDALQDKMDLGEEARSTWKGTPLGPVADDDEDTLKTEAVQAAPPPSDEDPPSPEAAATSNSGTGSGTGRAVPPPPSSSAYGSVACLAPCRPRRSPPRRSAQAWVEEGLIYQEGSGLDSNSGLGAGSGSAAGPPDEEEEAAVEEATVEAAAVEEVAVEEEPEKEEFLPAMGSPEQKKAFDWLYHSSTGLAVQCCVSTVAVVGIVIQSDAKWRSTTAGKVFEVLQWVAAVLFALEYVARLYACPANPKFTGRDVLSQKSAWRYWRDWPRLCYATDFMGTIDLLSWAPFFAAQAFEVGSDWSVALRMLQLVAVVKIDRQLPAFRLLDDVVLAGDTGRLLLCSAVMSCIMWLLFAAVLYIIEQERPEMDGAFSTMPSSLFITMIYIGGEWCRVDLEVPWGQLVGAVLALVGIGIIGIPVAIFFDGYSEIAEEYADTYLQSPLLEDEDSSKGSDVEDAKKGSD